MVSTASTEKESSMKVGLLSDLHLDFYQDSGVALLESISFPRNLDVLVIAGDIFEGMPNLPGRIPRRDMLLKIKEVSKAKHTLMVLGNHDVIRAPLDLVVFPARELCASIGITLLERDSVEIDGKRFHGATGWYSATTINPIFPEVRNSPGPHEWLLKQKPATLAYFKSKVKEGDIVITHHLPIWEAVHSYYLGSDLNPWFVSDYTEIVKENKPAVWMYGHTHIPAQFKAWDCKFYCNPVGYPSERKSNPVPKLKVIKID